VLGLLLGYSPEAIGQFEELSMFQNEGAANAEV